MYTYFISTKQYMTINLNSRASLLIFLILAAVIYQILVLAVKNNPKITVPVPDSLKPLLSNTDHNKIDYLGLLRGIFYIFVGYFMPNNYITVILFSIIYEMSQPLFGMNPKYIINPLINITAYTFGSLISVKKY